jgi:GT2 family glycosyltransferase
VSAVDAVLASTGATVDIVVVDNGCTGDGIGRVKDKPGVRVVTPADNTGYAGGCAIGAADATGQYLAFVNSDAIVTGPALARLAAVAAEPAVGMAMGSIRLADRPELMNTAGNPMHYVGFVWAGSYGQPAQRHNQRRRVMCGSGCCFVIRRDLWERLDGFAPEYFAYHEDTELSLRLWQQDYTIEFVPDAVVLHHYEFSRNALKLYLVERNRLVLLLTAYSRRSLILLSPMLALTEIATLTAALLGRWGRPKVRGYVWLWRNRSWVAKRRARLQAERTVPDRVVTAHMSSRIDATNAQAPPGVSVFNAVARGYWWLVRRML